MNFEEYQKLAETTAGKFPEEERIFWTLITTLGLTGEAGEVADYLKKVYGHGHKLDEVKLMKELGDVLWYVADICTKLNISLDDVASLNIEKLKARYGEGFSQQKSQNRKVGDI
jgi:NTP pyrophosphatase (non-canonical NTP hydrolase)